MNEFIVWNKKSKDFIRGNDFKINHKGNLVDFMGLNVNSKDFFNYIGKKDINDKKIYAYCSIVEFDYVILRDVVKIIATIRYCRFECGYKINILNHLEYSKVEFSFINVQNIKIIDTIQDNKLGLVK